MPTLRIAACQINTVVGDLAGNVGRVVDAVSRAQSAGADLAVLPELAITGYPPEDLLLKPGFVADNREALAQVAEATAECVAVVGFVDSGRDLHNAAAVCRRGQVVGVYHKRLLPNYAVFDERRYFTAGTGDHVLYLVGGVRMGVSICEDAWSPDGPIADQAAGGAELVVNLNASPFSAGRLAERATMLSTRAADSSCALVYVNLVGGQDELVFDGASLVLDEAGRVVATAPQFEEDVMVVDIEVRPSFRKRLLDPRGRHPRPPLETLMVSETARQKPDDRWPGRCEPLAPDEEIYRALVIGTAEYVRKNGFSDVVIGLSGGIDSSLVAAVAVDALGPDHVHGVAMPSRFSSEGSVSDARALAGHLGIDLQTVPIEAAHACFVDLLAGAGTDPEVGITGENLQSRIRGVLLMALSNAHGWMVLTTGNKSELATGYSTLYGDSAGGFAVIKDVPKTLVYRLCAWRNEHGGREVIPEAVLRKPPSAELRAGQLDSQSLPPYDQLDPVLAAYVEDDKTSAELEASGFDPALVRQVVLLVDRAEYKRRQNPPGVRVTGKAFGKDRRVPITNGYDRPAPPPRGSTRADGHRPGARGADLADGAPPARQRST